MWLQYVANNINLDYIIGFPSNCKDGPECHFIKKIVILLYFTLVYLKCSVIQSIYGRKLNKSLLSWHHTCNIIYTILVLVGVLNIVISSCFKKWQMPIMPKMKVFWSSTAYKTVIFKTYPFFVIFEIDVYTEEKTRTQNLILVFSYFLLLFFPRILVFHKNIDCMPCPPTKLSSACCCCIRQHKTGLPFDLFESVY